MHEWEARELLCEVGRRCWERQFVAANEGNFSYRIGENEILATPTLVSKGFMKPDDLCKINMEGHQTGGRLKPTSEALMHLEIYERRPEMKAVVHVHPPHATAFAVVGQPVPKCIVPEVEVFLHEIPIVSYATPGTKEFADAIRPYLTDFTVLLLQNHGAVAIGKDILDAYYKMEVIDQYCRILILARQIGEWNPLTQEAMQALFRTKAGLGLPDRRMSDPSLASCGIPAPAPVAPTEPARGSVEWEALIEKVTKQVLAALKK